MTLARVFQVESFLSRLALRYAKFDIVFHRYTAEQSVAWRAARAATIAHLKRWRNKLPDVRVVVLSKVFWADVDEPTSEAALKTDAANDDDNNNNKSAPVAFDFCDSWSRYYRAERPVFMLTDIVLGEYDVDGKLSMFDVAFACAARAQGLPLVAFEGLLVQGAEVSGHMQTPVHSTEYNAVLKVVCDALAKQIPIDGIVCFFRFSNSIFSTNLP